MDNVKIASELVRVAKSLLAVQEHKNWRGTLEGIDISSEVMHGILNERATRDVFSLPRHLANMLATLSPKFAIYRREALKYARDNEWKKPVFTGMPSKDGFKVWLHDAAQV